MGGERPIGELPPDERGPEKGFESPERDEAHAYTPGEMPVMTDGQLGHSRHGETNPEGSVDISNYEFQRNERPGGRARETEAASARDAIPTRGDE